MVYDNTDGAGLIFFTGVPGSKWSGVYKTLAKYPGINNTDNNGDRGYSARSYDNIAKEEFTRGLHSGVYFGPDNEYGHTFDDIESLSKDELLAEFKRPYANDDGIKILKSHWFLYSLDYLVELFPRATFIGVYLPDDISFKWWKTLGGWDIDYPVYDWFKNDAKIKEDIKEGNAHLLKFFAEKGLLMKPYANYELLGKTLGFDYNFGVEFPPPALIGVFNRGNCPGISLLNKLLIHDPQILTWFDRYAKVEKKCVEHL